MLLEKVVKKDKDNYKQKVEVLEKVVHALTRKTLSLETKVEELKKKKNTNDQITSGVKEKDTKMNDNSSFNHSEIKERCSTPKGRKEQEENVIPGSEMLNCKDCNYTCKKEKTLKNHILTKHDQHQCKECPEKTSNFIHLLKHIAEHHNKDHQAQYERSQDEDMKHNDGIDNVEDEQNEQDKSFEFQESKIDKFTVEKN